MKNSTALIALLTSVGLFFTLISPNYDKVKALMSQKSDYETITQNIQDLEKRRDELVVQEQNFPVEDLDKLSKVLPDNADSVSLAKNLDFIAGRYGISIKSVQVSNLLNQGGAIDIGNGKAYEPIEVSFAFTASYSNFRKFMADLEKSLRLSDVKGITFTANDQGVYDFNIKITTYWLTSNNVANNPTQSADGSQTNTTTQ